MASRQGNRRRPIWEFELDTAKQQLNQQFGTRDLVGFGVEQAKLGLCAAGCLIQYVKDTQRTALPHIRSLTWDRQDQSVILMPRRGATLNSLITWRVEQITRLQKYSTIVLPHGQPHAQTLDPPTDAR